MAKLEKLPEKYIIDGFKGEIDFYYWKGIPVARKWPTFRPYPFSEAQEANQQAFAYINKLYSQMSLSVIVGFTLIAARTSQTPKDYIVRAYMKGMIAVMPPEYYATEETQLLLLAQLDVALSTRALEAGGNLAAILAQLDVATSTRALEAGGNLASILARLNAIKLIQGNLTTAFKFGPLASDPGWTAVLTYTGKGLLESLDFSTDYNQSDIYITLDGASLRIPQRNGATQVNPRPIFLNQIGGEAAHWKETLYDVVNDYYVFHLKRPIQFNSTLNIYVRQQSGVNKNVSCWLQYRTIT